MNKKEQQIKEAILQELIDLLEKGLSDSIPTDEEAEDCQRSPQPNS